MADLDDLLPKRETDPNVDIKGLMAAEVQKEEERLQRKLTLAELARIHQNIKQYERNAAIYDGHETKTSFMKSDAPIIEEIKADAIKVIKPGVVATRQPADIVGASRQEVQKLLNKLGVNLNVQLTKNDTHNLLATLMTCNEKQLEMLMKHPKLPVAIKIVIRRILDDAKIGDVEFIERLWDRIFGKNTIKGVTEAPDGYQGILPSVPVSRQAYIVIRETIIGNAD